jgi:hypothetical protein
MCIILHKQGNTDVIYLITAIKDKFDDWRDFLVRSLTGARTAPSYLLDKVGVIKLSRNNFQSFRHFLLSSFSIFS